MATTVVAIKPAVPQRPHRENQCNPEGYWTTDTALEPSAKSLKKKSRMSEAGKKCIELFKLHKITPYSPNSCTVPKSKMH
uniref:Uncharacterized protein n=1 Tax=Parascaris equorum TaxID=6256 RepID=A0A914R5M6_PAREQ